MKHACRQATKLASDSLERRLSVWETLRLRMHLLLCRNCQRCDASIKTIHQTAELIRHSQYGKIKLSEEQRQRLLKAIENELHC